MYDGKLEKQFDEEARRRYFTQPIPEGQRIPMSMWEKERIDYVGCKVWSFFDWVENMPLLMHKDGFLGIFGFKRWMELGIPISMNVDGRVCNGYGTLETYKTELYNGITMTLKFTHGSVYANGFNRFFDFHPYAVSSYDVEFSYKGAFPLSGIAKEHADARKMKWLDMGIEELKKRFLKFECEMRTAEKSLDEEPKDGNEKVLVKG